MSLFLNWLTFRDTATLLRLRLLEHAEFFRPGDYAPLFDAELEKVIARIHDPNLRRQVEGLKGFDWANYISRSLLRAGFRDDDQQEAFHSIAIKLLVSPGGLFARWEPGKHGPLERRFRTSVWNAIRNAQEKSHNHSRRFTAADPTTMASMYAGRQSSNSNLIEQFRELVKERLGDLALAILDERLQGKDTKNLVGKSEFGTPSAFYVKKQVQAIKKLADAFAARHGDSDFSNLLAKAMNAEMQTIAKRQRAMAAKSA